jgi:hypothetical protein
LTWRIYSARTTRTKTDTRRTISAKVISAWFSDTRKHSSASSARKRKGSYHVDNTLPISTSNSNVTRSAQTATTYCAKNFRYSASGITWATTTTSSNN